MAVIGVPKMHVKWFKLFEITKACSLSLPWASQGFLASEEPHWGLREDSLLYTLALFICVPDSFMRSIPDFGNLGLDHILTNSFWAPSIFKGINILPITWVLQSPALQLVSGDVERHCKVYPNSESLNMKQKSLPYNRAFVGTQECSCI